MDNSPSFKDILDVQDISTRLQIQHWLNYELFTYQFWFLLALLILPWFIWWRLADRRRFFEILIFMFLVQTAVTILDEFGCQLNLWEYQYDLEPLFPRLIPINFTLFPIGYGLIYQYFPKWKHYLAASAVASALYAFIGEWVFIRMDIYVLLEWKHIYSFPIYILLAAIFKLLMARIMKVSQKYA